MYLLYQMHLRTLNHHQLLHHYYRMFLFHYQFQHLLMHAVKALDNSIYIVEGEAEPNAKSITDEYCSCNPAIEISTLTGTKHLPHVENPENFLEQVKIFF